MLILLDSMFHLHLIKLQLILSLVKLLIHPFNEALLFEGVQLIYFFLIARCKLFFKDGKRFGLFLRYIGMLLSVFKHYFIPEEDLEPS